MMKPSNTILALTIIGLALLVQWTMAKHDYMDEEGPSDAHGLIYSTGGRPSSRKQVTRALKTLRNMYNNLEFREYLKKETNMLESDIELAKKAVDQFWYAHEITKDKCKDGKYLADLDGLIQKNAIYKVNLVPYLVESRRRQAAVCDNKSKVIRYAGKFLFLPTFRSDKKSSP